MTLEWHRLDRYGRPIADVTLDGLDVNAEQVKRCMAWVYLQYSQDAKLIALEREARAAKLGLWEQPDPIAPWQWRQAHRAPLPEAEGIGMDWPQPPTLLKPTIRPCSFAKASSTPCA